MEVPIRSFVDKDQIRRLGWMSMMVHPFLAALFSAFLEVIVSMFPVVVVAGGGFVTLEIWRI